MMIFLTKKYEFFNSNFFKILFLKNVPDFGSGFTQNNLHPYTQNTKNIKCGKENNNYQKM